MTRKIEKHQQKHEVNLNEQKSRNRTDETKIEIKWRKRATEK